MRISSLLLGTLVLALSSWFARPETTPVYSTDSKQPHEPDSYSDGASPIEFIGLESIIASAASLSSLSGAIAMSSIAIDELLKIVTASKLDSRDALSENLLALKNETRFVALNVQSFDIEANMVINRAIFDGKRLLKETGGHGIARTWQLFTCKLMSTTLTPSRCINTLQLCVQFKAFLNSLEMSLFNLDSLIPALEEDLRRTQMTLNAIGGLSDYETRIKVEEGFSIVEEITPGEGGQHLATLNNNSKTLRMVNAHRVLATRRVFATRRELWDMAVAFEELRRAMPSRRSCNANWLWS